jgi:hypothetical protein
MRRGDSVRTPNGPATVVRAETVRGWVAGRSYPIGVVCVEDAAGLRRSYLASEVRAIQDEAAEEAAGGRNNEPQP